MTRLAARIARRLLFGVLSVALVLAATRALTAIAPGRFADELRLVPGLAQESVSAAERQHSTMSGAGAAWWALFLGNPGRSLATGLPVVPLVAERAVNTLLLTIPATAMAWVFALVVVSRHGTHGRSATPLTRAGLIGLQAMPDLVLGLLLVRLAWSTEWLPVGGRGTGLDIARHATLAVVGLALSQLPLLVRHLTALIDSLDRGLLVTAARARGVSSRAIYWRHLVPVMLPGLAPLLAVSFAALFGSSLVFEIVFDWPGLGALLLEAVFARDLPVVFGCVLASSVLLVVSNAAADVLEYASDPRLRS